MKKKIILITGASSGIGKETALALAKQGHKIIIHGRNPEKTKKVYETIINENGNKDIDMYTADLSLMSEVKKFANKIIEHYDHIDVLVNNAGGQFGGTREVTAEGHEKTLAINTLYPFLLTNLLLPLLMKSKSARIVTVASESYRQGGKPIYDDIELERNYSLFKSYGLSKLYVWWIMRQFATRLKEKGINNVTVNTVEPGSAITSLARVSMKKHPLMLIISILWLPFMRSAKYGAKTSIYMATSENAEGVTGKFYGKCKEKNINKKWLSEEGEQKIWDFCIHACEPYLTRNEILEEVSE
ncbi:SDR family NAD(P)-dependent oxidoreductase [Clostridium tyrobutyricum]|nr:SDR family NAD(P)-dependent oxidoreductase [Clostridium tyrobutyricum]MBV4428371.1 SDR family NAD(P)-dependent oxidoreductase [Clostridium tyrobutyricum]MBV4443422.1 SDR family NAD(P)-dependent oxidoreductase [Clostridium tyrobutyricum]